MRNSRGGRQQSHGNRPARPMDWVCATLDVALGGTDIACAWLIDPIETLETFTDPTLMATRAFVQIRIEGASFVGIGGFAAIGLIAWDGVTALPPLDCPGPLSDCDFDWVARWVGVINRQLPAATILNPNVFDNTHLSRARRRLPTQTGLLVVFETESANSSVHFGIDLRCLIKE